MDKRGKQLRARCRPDEHALVEQRAASVNRDVSDYLRELGKYGRIVVRQFQTISPADRHDLARIGSTLNQIARICNQTGDSMHARNIETVLGELRRLLYRFETIAGPGDELGQGTQNQGPGPVV